MSQVQENKAEEIAQQVKLILEEFEITVTPQTVVFKITKSPAELTLKEWRIVKTFVDNIISEMRTATR
jgi:hypothetical protein